MINGKGYVALLPESLRNCGSGLRFTQNWGDLLLRLP